MRRRPWILVVLAGLHFISPIGNLIFNALWIGVSPVYYIQQAIKVASLEHLWIEIVIPIAAGVSIYICKRWSFMLYLLCMLVLFAASYMGYKERQSPAVLAELIFVFIFNIGVVGYFLIPAVREVYFNPRLRWWETENRFHADIAAHYNYNNMDHQGTISNISNSGLFFKADQIPDDHAQIAIRFPYAGSDYYFRGTTIHHGQQNQMGFGVQFVHDQTTTKTIRVLTKKLLSEGKLILDRKPNKEDSFAQWVKDLFFTGKGILPSSKRKS